jgi:uncharacterized protein with GYD domain
MAMYLIKGKYTDRGTKGLVHEGGSKRRQAMISTIEGQRDKLEAFYYAFGDVDYKGVSSTIEGLGGKIEAFYYAFGDVDIYMIVELPDPIAAVALSITINQSGSVTVETIPLVTPEEMDKAVNLSVTYLPPS